MSDSDDKLAARHSLYSCRVQNISAQNVCKSDMNLPSGPASWSYAYPQNTKNSCGEYYKRYDHDELHVKDHASYTIITNTNTATGDSEKFSITNSDLDKLEKKVLCNISNPELQTDETSVRSLDSNLKFFKTTVQQIFDSFYTSMRDFEVYKKKFHAILARNKEDSIAEMEEFVKNMIQHIMSSDTSVTKDSRLSTEVSYDSKDQDTNITSGDSEVTTSASGRLLENLHSVVEAYKNENYMTDSTLEENASKIKRQSRNGEIFNIYLLNAAPFVEIKMNDRNLVSEINLKDPISSAESKVASAEDLKKLAAKRIELEQYVKQQQDSHMPDREIPVRISSAKKDIHLNEDFVYRDRDENKSFMSKICNYLCKKLRKNTFS